MINLKKDITQIAEYLKRNHLLQVGEALNHIETPGSGNMNFTLRVITTHRSFILKQSRDYVEKFPQIKAPADRVIQEAEFYEKLSSHQYLAARTPDVLYIDKENKIMMLNDLGDSSDMTYLYQGNMALTDQEISDITDFIIMLHSNFNLDNESDRIVNEEMRKLNHEHIFVYPFLDENGIDLEEICTGLSIEAESLKKDSELKEKAVSLGQIYMGRGDTLLHGDYFPGSWLKTEKGFKVIDPEFCFHGPKEFELGVLIAHMYLSNQELETIKKISNHYQNKVQLNGKLLENFIGIEIIRRIIGLAQLPLEMNIEQRRTLLRMASNFIKS